MQYNAVLCQQQQPNDSSAFPASLFPRFARRGTSTTRRRGRRRSPRPCSTLSSSFFQVHEGLKDELTYA
ncbi:hypothetical protein ACMD2_25409 [Ananas comosus]|uniref:Uncharacterized protein n=1 Tax=Ananas comosus TaxID=4615 RepID=A0A199UQ55_ANACO|nr:hypothetical protein ACMD2_25409 [Ananas comosus]